MLIALKKMPGIIKLHLALLDEKPTPAARPGGMSTEQTMVAMFADRNGGPISVDEVQAELGGARSKTYSALYALKKKGVLQQVGKGEYKLSAKAMQLMTGKAPTNAPAKPTTPALPKPRSHPPAKRNGHAVLKPNSGRAERGTGLTALRQVLSDSGPMKFAEIRAALGETVSSKSVRGIIDRARRDGFLKKRPSGEFELTAKGALPASPESSQLQLGGET
ncbi:hypothetical protein [Bradyrhizobium elkanii]|uniref:hypothetical protein n=1 Tax=Bradyrhizobium elkanii TaxID=29448 RepID=UPI0012BC76BA|nr:hypothetical protein [Bradyrhizobium elkanii]